MTTLRNTARENVDRPMGGDDFPVITSTPGRAEYVFSHGGLDRLFLVYVPGSATKTLPLMVALHGGGGRATQMFDSHPLEASADERGYIMVAAQGAPKDGAENSFDWNGHAVLDSGVDDVGYLERVILGVSTALAVDPARRYVAGFSGGASMAVRFGAEKSELLAAIGTFAGKVGLSVDGAPFAFPQAPNTPLSVQMTYGTRDPNFAGELKTDDTLGDIQATSARAGIDWWAESLSCRSSPKTETRDGLTFDTYTGGEGGTLVRMVTVAGMGHTWPENQPKGTKLLLDFFGDKVKGA